jgi:hypothetical protein
MVRVKNNAAVTANTPVPSMLTNEPSAMRRCGPVGGIRPLSMNQFGLGAGGMAAYSSGVVAEVWISVLATARIPL